jgi:hypothetical protein
MTIVLGPPGSSKSSLMKSLSGRLQRSSESVINGAVTYNGQEDGEGGLLFRKISSYVDECDEHLSALTVQETVEFAWKAASGGHHSYLITADPVGAALLNRADGELARVSLSDSRYPLDRSYDNIVVNRCAIPLSYLDCRMRPIKWWAMLLCEVSVAGRPGDSLWVGLTMSALSHPHKHAMVGEMLMGQGRPVLFLDAVSNGLDAATTLDMAQSLQVSARVLKTTVVASLLQVSHCISFSNISVESSLFRLLNSPLQKFWIFLMTSC